MATEGNQPGQTSRHQASLWADYTIPQGDFAGLGFGAGVRYIGPSFGDNLEDLNVPGYTLADAAIHYDWNSFKLRPERQQPLRQGLCPIVLRRDPLLLRRATHGSWHGDVPLVADQPRSSVNSSCGCLTPRRA